MKKLSIFVSIVFCFMLVLSFQITVFADMGPKDSLTVYVNNPPSEPYYLDLLTQESSKYNNFHNDGEREAYNQKMLNLLYSYKDEGWLPAFTEGSGAPLWGELTGKPENNRMVHNFGYRGVPDTYRIIIVTESGNVTVSDIYTRKALQSSITYDYENGKATVPNILLTYLAQFSITFSLTILIEGIVLLLFGIKLKDNWKVFLGVNFITQIFLTLTVGVALIKSGTINAYLIQLPAELVILITEALIYKRFLVGVNGKRKVAYAVTANLASWILGFILLNHLFWFLSIFL